MPITPEKGAISPLQAEPVKKQNCWEIRKCGREPGGDKVDNHGVCPAAVDTSSDGINRGNNAGRFCWAIAGTLCDGKVQSIFAMKIESCLKCEVFRGIASEEEDDFVLHKSEPEPARTPE